jgi:polar amino acid transport system substrate-binding protein
MEAKRFLAGVVASVLAWLPPGPVAAQDTAGVRTAVHPDYEPYSGVGLHNGGFAYDLLIEALKRSGRRVEITATEPWARGLRDVIEGRIDALGAVWRTPERDKVLLFSDPIATSRIVFAKRAGDPFEYRELGDLAGKVVGTVTGYGYTDAFLADGRYRREPIGSTAQNLGKLALGRIDLTLDDASVLAYLLRREVPTLQDRVVLTSGALQDYAMFIAFSRKGRPDIEAVVADFNAGLAAMRGDGSYDAMTLRHGLR